LPLLVNNKNKGWKLLLNVFLCECLRCAAGVCEFEDEIGKKGGSGSVKMFTLSRIETATCWETRKNSVYYLSPLNVKYIKLSHKSSGYFWEQQEFWILESMRKQIPSTAVKIVNNSMKHARTKKISCLSLFAIHQKTKNHDGY
jgi:hypothetical protein